MFVINSTHALSWPALRFKLDKGDNQFENGDAIPEGARSKLAYLAANGVVVFSEQLAWAPKPAAKADKKPAAKADDFDPADVELTTEALGKLKFDQLKRVAESLEIDASAAKSKDEVRDLILKAASDTSV